MKAKDTPLSISTVNKALENRGVGKAAARDVWRKLFARDSQGRSLLPLPRNLNVALAAAAEPNMTKERQDAARPIDNERQGHSAFVIMKSKDDDNETTPLIQPQENQGMQYGNR